MTETRTLLSYNIPEMVDLKMEILIDRNYDVPDDFYTMIDDDFIIRVTFSQDDTNEKRQFISKYLPRFHSYKYLVTYAIETGQLSRLAMFDSLKVARCCKRLRDMLSVSMVDTLIEAYISYIGYAPDCMVALRWNIECGRFWFLVKAEQFTSRVEDYIQHITSDYQEDHIMPALHTVLNTVSRKVFDLLQKRGNVLSLSDYYDNGGVFLDNRLGMENITSYIEHGVPGELMSREAMAMLKEENLVLYRSFIWESVKINPDNIKYVDWRPSSLRSLDNQILSANTPLTDFGEYVRLYKSIIGNVKLSNMVITKYIESGVDINTMLDYIENIFPYLPSILRYGKSEHLEKFLQSDIKLPSLVIRKVGTEESSQMLNNYIALHVFPSVGSTVVMKIAKIMITNLSIWETIDTPIRLSILGMVNVVEVAKEHPSILQLPNIFSIIPMKDLQDICMENPDAISYVPANDLPISLWKDIVRIHHYKPLQPTTMINGEVLMTMVQDGYGYGYILDLATTQQKNAIAKMYLLNRI